MSGLSGYEWLKICWGVFCSIWRKSIGSNMKPIYKTISFFLALFRYRLALTLRSCSESVNFINFIDIIHVSWYIIWAFLASYQQKCFGFYLMCAAGAIFLATSQAITSFKFHEKREWIRIPKIPCHNWAIKKNTGLFRVCRWLYYPVVWWFLKDIYKDPLSNNQASI